MASTQGANNRAQQQQHYHHHQQQQHIRQRLLEQLQQRKADYVSSYELPLNYPAKVVPVTTDNNGDDNSGSTTSSNNNTGLRTSSDFINARLLEAGVPLGSTQNKTSSSSLADQSVSINRFIKDIEGTGCYDAVQLHLSHHSQSAANTAAEQQSQQSSSSNNNLYDISVKLKEKKWYKLYIGGGVNSDDLSSIGSSGSNTSANGLLGSKLLQFETSASLLNLTGYTDISSLSYIVDQTGSASFKFIHDRPLISYLNTNNVVRRWLLPPDPREMEIERNNNNNGKSASLVDDDEETQIYQNDDMQYAIGGGSHTTLGIHATMHDNDYESTRSYKEYVRSIGLRLANHSRGATPSSSSSGYSYKPSTSSPTSMAGPYLFLDWNIGINDILPKRTSSHPFVLDCSPDIAKQAGTYIKHTLRSGAYLNGCYVDDRYDPTMGYDGHLVGEIAGPPGDVGYWKVNGGWSMHMPVELLKMMIMGVNDDDNNDVGSGYIERNDVEEKDSPLVIGMTLHSSFNCGILRPLTFNGLIGSNAATTKTAMVPSSDRFYIGGPNQLRGFLPAGIGPRANNGGSSVPGGDALGGDLFYTGLLATSIPFPTYFATLRNNGARLFGFANAGTCVAANNVMSSSVCNQILQSTRVSVGGGVSAGTPMGRFEATYAIPLRYGPRDARKSAQFGFGFSFG